MEGKFTLSKKILTILSASIGFTVLFSFFFIHYLYSELYLKSMKNQSFIRGNKPLPIIIMVS